VPRCNGHLAERLMEKEMKFTTRSQLRRVIGKVCSNESLRNVRPCYSCRYRPDEEKACTIYLCQGKASKSEAQEAVFTQPEGEF